MPFEAVINLPSSQFCYRAGYKPTFAFCFHFGQVVAECTLKESAAINQILGRRWHALDRTDQAKYYEMARRERAVHMQKYPGT